MHLLPLELHDHEDDKSQVIIKCFIKCFRKSTMSNYLFMKNQQGFVQSCKFLLASRQKYDTLTMCQVNIDLWMNFGHNGIVCANFYR